MCIMDSYNPLIEQVQEKMVEFLPSINSPSSTKTIPYFSSRTPLHNFKLPQWGSQKLHECVKTYPKITNKPKQSKRRDGGLEYVPEKSVKRRKVVFSFSLRKEEIERDFILVTGREPRRMKGKKISGDFQKELNKLVPGSWLSEINCA